LSDDTSDLDMMLGFFAEKRRNQRDPEEHLPPETLTAYQAGDLSPEEDERIQDHLAQCRHCTEMLLELEELLRPAEVGAESVADFEAETDWRKLQSRLSKPAETRSPWPLKATLLAASLTGGVLLLGFFSWEIYSQKEREVIQLQSQVAELQQPVASPPFLPLRSVRGEGGALAVPAGRAVWLTFDTPVPDDYSEYRAQIMDEEGKVRWAGTLNKDKEGKLPFLLINGYLEPGEYAVRLMGVRKGSLDLLQENRIRVPSGSPGSQGR